MIATNAFRTIHIVDDEHDAVNLARTIAEMMGFHCRSWESSQVFFNAVPDLWGDGDVLLLDIYMPDKDAIEVMTHLSRYDLLVPMVLISGKNLDSLEFTAKLATALGHNPVVSVQKPLTEKKLRDALQQLRSMMEPTAS